ncbi:hypothetical protein ACFVAD_20550 [Sutcliffiella sp. NPDC057660]|uniref:hypothetical protein n=1 Tax=Sutcliffiella sp. NPDC057660 TaxID=3346199 RepID=UPI003690E9F6
MRIEFYTKDAHFLVENNQFFKDGELLAEGNIFPFQTLWGLPALFIVTTSEFCPPQFLQTEAITSVLACNEYLDGEQAVKQMYEVIYTMAEYDDELFFLLPAVDSEHVKQMFKLFHPGAEVQRVSKWQSQSGKFVAC